MRPRIARLVVVATFLVPVVATTAPAHGFYAFSAAFVGTLQLSGGLDYPCNPTTLGTLPCPPGPPSVDPLFLPGDPVPQGNLDWQHNTRTSTLVSSTCVVGGVATPDKPLGPATAGPCGLTAGGTLSGYCGLMGTQKNGTFFNGHSTVNIGIHVNVFAGVAIVDGHWIKSNGQHGLLLGTALVVPPTPVTTPGQSCVNKSAATFTVVGVLVFVTSPLL